MIQLILWLLFIIGSSYVLTQSEIGAEFRSIFDFKQYNRFKDKIHYLVNCIVCGSFYTSIFASAFYSPTAIFGIPVIIQFILNAFIAVGATFIVYKLIPKDLFE